MDNGGLALTTSGCLWNVKHRRFAVVETSGTFGKSVRRGLDARGISVLTGG
jgi:hypothetical protein